MRNIIRYAVLALIPLLGAAAQAAGFAQGLSVGMKQGAIQQAQADMRSSGSQESMGKPQSAPETGPATAGSRMSEEGKLNTNGPAALDRDKGRARAEDRTNAHPRKQARKSDERKYKSSNLD